MIGARIPEVDHELLHRLAAEKGVSTSQYLADLIREKVSKYNQKKTEFSSQIGNKSSRISLNLTQEIIEKLAKRVQSEKIKRSDFLRRVLSAELGLKK